MKSSLLRNFTVTAQFPADLAHWLTKHAKTRPQGGTVSQVLRELVVDLRNRTQTAPLETAQGIPTVRELRKLAGKGGSR